MPKTLAELRQSPHIGPRTDTHQICLSGELREELKRRDAELIEANAKVARYQAGADDDEPAAPPRRHGQRGSLAVLEKAAKAAAAKADEVYFAAREHEVEVVVTARENGAWRNWCAQHPAREDDRRDQDEFGGFCNADDLIADLGAYVTAISGVAVKAGDWDFVAANSSPGDLKDLAKKVVLLHETGSGDLGKSRADWLADRMS